MNIVGVIFVWSIIQFDPKQVSRSLRSRCENIENQLYLYHKDAFQEIEDARHAYGSLKTEGSTLTFVETSMIMRGEFPRNGSMKNRDISEAVGLAAALKEVRYLVDSTVPFSEDIVKRIHKTCSNGLLNPASCGVYKTSPNYIGRGNYITAAPNQVNKLMRQLFEAILKEFNPIIRAAFFGFNYVSIHPFIDFNGRTSRLFECYILAESGMPFISLKDGDIQTYLNILMKGQEEGKAYYEPYIEFILKRVEERFDEIV